MWNTITTRYIYICFNFDIYSLLIVLIKLFYSFKTCLKVFFASVVYWAELPALLELGPDRSRVSSIKSSIKIWYSILAPPSGRVSCPWTSTPALWWRVVQATGPGTWRVSLLCNPGLPSSSWLQGALPSHTAASTSREGWFGQDNLSSRPLRPYCVACSFKL